MVSGKRVLLILLVLLGPGLIIYFISKTVNNHFLRLPYLGYEYTMDANGNKVDSTAYQVPEFALTNFNAKLYLKQKFVFLTNGKKQSEKYQSS